MDRASDADAAVTEVPHPTEPTAASWVLVLGSGTHAHIRDLTPGARFAFQRRVYERVEGLVRPTGEVLGRVVNTFVRTAEDVIDVDIGYPDGTTDTLTGTPNHPFWVPEVGDYVELKDLEVGTVLRTFGGSEATVLGLTWKPGEVEVYDIEVEGLHNFFVRGAGSDAPGVLVHNSTGPRGLLQGPVPKINMGQQGKHIVGHNNFLEGRSVLTADPHDLGRAAGMGQPIGNTMVGLPGSKERVVYDRVIGQYVDPAGQAVDTTVGIIHYSNNGIHIVPGRPQ